MDINLPSIDLISYFFLDDETVDEILFVNRNLNRDFLKGVTRDNVTYHLQIPQAGPSPSQAELAAASDTTTTSQPDSNAPPLPRLDGMSVDESSDEAIPSSSDSDSE